MSQKPQQVSSPFSSKIPRFDPKLYHAEGHPDHALTYGHSTRLKKSISHFNTKERRENTQKRRSEPDILSSTGDTSFTDKINVTWNSHHIGFKCDAVASSKEYAAGVSGDVKLKREELSLSHLPSFLSDMEDDNASLESLGILTPSQMKDFLEEEIVPDSNVVEIIDINGQKIECKLHYEDMQWSSPFLSLTSDNDLMSAQSLLNPSNANYDEAVTPTPEICDKVEEATQKVDYSVTETGAQSANQENTVECGYAADSESDICVNNQQIIEMIQNASAKQDKKMKLAVLLSESGYNADNESDVLSDVSQSPTEEKFLLRESQADSIQRESVTDSGFYSETRGSCIVGSESDFDEAPHLKARNAQVIDGKLYYSQQNVEKLNETLTESNLVDRVEMSSTEKNAQTYEIESKICTEKNIEAMITCDSSQIEDSLSETIMQVDTVVRLSESDKSSQVNNAKKVSKTSRTVQNQESKYKKPQVTSKLKQMIDNKSVEDLSNDVKYIRKPASPKKNRWDSITSKIAASLADDKKNLKQREIKSKIDNKGSIVAATNKDKMDSKSPISTTSNRITKSGLKTALPSNKDQSSSKPLSIKRTVKKSSLSQKENRPSSARSNCSDNSKPIVTSGTRKTKQARTNIVKEKVSHRTNSPSIKSFKSSQESISSVSKAKNQQISGTNTLALKSNKPETIGVEISFDQPDLIATAEYEVKVNELKNEKENLAIKNEELQREIEQLNVLYEEDRLKFGNQLDEMKLQIKTIHIEYGEEAHKQSERFHKLYRELETVTKNYNDLNTKSELKIEQLITLNDQQKSEEKRLKENYEEKIQKMKQDQEMQLFKMNDPHKLFQEIDSLKIVLDLKTEEIHSLRKHNMEMNKELEDLPSTQEKVRKLTAKIEDLQALLSIKSNMERSLTVEHESLKQTVETESKVNKRLSMEIEELQWKLKQSETDIECSPAATRPQSYCRSTKRSSSVSFFDSSPKSPSKRNFSVSICQISPSKQTQTEPFPLTYVENNDKGPVIMEVDKVVPNEAVKMKNNEPSEIKPIPNYFVSCPSEDKVELGEEDGESAEVLSDKNSVKSAQSELLTEELESSACTNSAAYDELCSSGLQDSVFGENLDANTISVTSLCDVILNEESSEVHDVSMHHISDVSRLDPETTIDQVVYEDILPTNNDESKQLAVPCANEEPRLDADSSDSSSPDDSGTYSEPTVKSVVLVKTLAKDQQPSDDTTICEKSGSTSDYCDKSVHFQAISPKNIHPSDVSCDMPDHSSNSQNNDLGNTADTLASNLQHEQFSELDLTPNACSTPKLKNSSIAFEIKINSSIRISNSNQDSSPRTSFSKHGKSSSQTGQPFQGTHVATAISPKCYCDCCPEHSH